jgi:hypothetical protein
MLNRGGLESGIEVEFGAPRFGGEFSNLPIAFRSSLPIEPVRDRLARQRRGGTARASRRGPQAGVLFVGEGHVEVSHRSIHSNHDTPLWQNICHG